MSDHSFDFYDEALKTFDAPLPPSAEPAPQEPPATQEVPAEVPQRRKPLGRKIAFSLLVCLLAAAACAALLRTPQEPQEPKWENAARRGTQWVYGVAVSSSEEDRLLLLTDDGEYWDVSCVGVELPPMGDMLSSYLPRCWVFYNDDAQPDPNGEYDRSITAVTVLNPDEVSAPTELSPDPDGNLRDYIRYDLDGDGTAEHVFLYSSPMIDIVLEDSQPATEDASDAYWESVLDFAASYTSYLMQVYAVNEQGIILYSAYFPRSTNKLVFCDSADSLRILSTANEVMELRMNDEQLLCVYLGDACISS